MKEKESIYAIIVTYNAMKWADKCFCSLMESTVPIEIVVVDNGSKDGTVDYIKNNYPNIKLLVQPKNLGFGQGNNLGIKFALAHGATHLLLLNQDAWIDKDMIQILLNYDDGNTLLSPIHMTGENDRLDKNFCTFAVMRSYGLRKFINDLIVNQPDIYETYEINAACWFIPKSIFMEIGGFNPLFFHYAEDNDYLQRLHYHKKKVCFVPKTRAYHDRANIPTKPLTLITCYQKLVLNAVNIQKPFIVGLLGAVKYVLSVIYNGLKNRDKSYISIALRSSCKFIHNIFKIYSNRIEIKSKKPHWLL